MTAGGTETPYLRAGRGHPLVLVVRDMDDPEVLALSAELAQRFTVFMASPGIGTARELTEWLRQFLEGLGVCESHLMLHASMMDLLYAS